MEKKIIMYALLILFTIISLGWWGFVAEDRAVGKKMMIPVKIYSTQENTKVFFGKAYVGETSELAEKGWFLEKKVPTGKYHVVCEGISEQTLIVEGPIEARC